MAKKNWTNTRVRFPSNHDGKMTRDGMRKNTKAGGRITALRATCVVGLVKNGLPLVEARDYVSHRTTEECRAIALEILKS